MLFLGIMILKQVKHALLTIQTPFFRFLTNIQDFEPCFCCSGELFISGFFKWSGIGGLEFVHEYRGLMKTPTMIPNQLKENVKHQVRNQEDVLHRNTQFQVLLLPLLFDCYIYVVIFYLLDDFRWVGRVKPGSFIGYLLSFLSFNFFIHYTINSANTSRLKKKKIRITGKVYN